MSKSAPTHSGRENKSRSSTPTARNSAMGTEQNEGVLYVTLLARQNEKDHRKKMRVIEVGT